MHCSCHAVRIPFQPGSFFPGIRVAPDPITSTCGSCISFSGYGQAWHQCGQHQSASLYRVPLNAYHLDLHRNGDLDGVIDGLEAQVVVNFIDHLLIHTSAQVDLHTSVPPPKTYLESQYDLFSLHHIAKMSTQSRRLPAPRTPCSAATSCASSFPLFFGFSFLVP